MFDWCIVVDGLQLSTTKVLPSKKLKKQTSKQERNKKRCQHCGCTLQDLDVQSLHVALCFTEGHSHSS